MDVRKVEYVPPKKRARISREPSRTLSAGATMGSSKEAFDGDRFARLKEFGFFIKGGISIERFRLLPR